MAPPWQAGTTKAINGITSGMSAPASGLNVQFRAPAMATRLQFRGVDLFASIARTTALGGAPPQLLQALAAAAGAPISVLVDDAGQDFSVTTDVNFLADETRTNFSARLGTGIADQYMTALGYVWRANARSIIPTGPAADFVYDGGPTNNLGAVLCEAKGSVARLVSRATVSSTATSGYRNQVSHHVGTTPSTYPILHGYAVSFGTMPGSTSSIVHVEQTAVAALVGGQVPGPVGPTSQANAVIALTNFRDAFALANARTTVRMIDAVLGHHMDAFKERPSQRYGTIVLGEDEYLFGDEEPRLPPLHFANEWDPVRRPFRGLFAIHRSVVEEVHKALETVLFGGRQTLDLPVFDREFLGQKRAYGAAFPDGVTYVRPPVPGGPQALLGKVFNLGF